MTRQAHRSAVFVALLTSLVASADSGKLNVNVDLGVAMPLTGRYGSQSTSTYSAQSYGIHLLAGIDYQISPPIALELQLGLGAQFLPPAISYSNNLPYKPSTFIPFFVGIGPRFRFLDDTSGYANEKGKPDGDLWASLHVGLHSFGTLQFGVDAALGYQWSVLRPLSIGPFLKGAVLIDTDPGNKGAQFVMTVGAAASFELIPLKQIIDTDGDGLADELEVSKYLTNPEMKDTDGDGLPDGLEVETKTNPRSIDTDDDGLKDGEEDSNKNGKVDSRETDPRKADMPEGPPTPPPLPPVVAPTEATGLDLTEEAPSNDTDSDGVENTKDKCPDTAPKLTVDAKGCVVIGKSFVLEGVTFASGKSTILPQSAKVLEQALATLNDNPEIKVEVGGHTDSQGKPAANAKLSQARADAVKTWLINHGLAGKRISGTKGYGAKNPRATNATADGRAKNRRIEFKRTDI
jgi:outer membrane protein OmpA-like peptidoglycan-associated protein